MCLCLRFSDHLFEHGSFKDCRSKNAIHGRFLDRNIAARWLMNADHRCYVDLFSILLAYLLAAASVKSLGGDLIPAPEFWLRQVEDLVPNHHGSSDFTLSPRRRQSLGLAYLRIFCGMVGDGYWILDICHDNYLSVYLSVCLSIYLSVCLSVCLSVHLPVSVYPSICLSIDQSVSLVL